MEENTRYEIDKHFDGILNLLSNGKETFEDTRLQLVYDTVRECGEKVSEILDTISDEDR